MKYVKLKAYNSIWGVLSTDSKRDQEEKEGERERDGDGRYIKEIRRTLPPPPKTNSVCPNPAQYFVGMLSYLANLLDEAMYCGDRTDIQVRC